MLDWITLFVNNISPELIKYLESKLEFVGSFSLLTGAEKSHFRRKEKDSAHLKTLWRKAVYKNEFEIMIGCKLNPLTNKYDYCLKVKGSIHKLVHKGDNSGFLSEIEAVKTLNNLCDDLHIDKEQAVLNCLEVGINIHFIDALEFLDLNLVKRYKDKPFDRNAKYAHSGYIASLSHYDAKLYAKRKDVLRFEIRWNNLQGLRKHYKLQTVANLTPELINKIALEVLPERVKHIICLNGIDIVTKITKRTDGMKLREQLLLTQFNSDNYLNQLNKRLNNCLPEKRNAIYQADRRSLIKFRNTIKKYQNLDLVELIKSEIFTQVKKQKCQLSKTGRSPLKPILEKGSQCTAFNTGINLKKLTYNRKESRDERMNKIINSLRERNLIKRVTVGSIELIN